MKIQFFLRNGIVVTERNNSASQFLKKVNEIFDKGPQRLPESEIQARKTWYLKMLSRAKDEDLEGNYRRHWLLVSLLEDYFHLRSLWFLGSKDSFSWLKRNDPVAFERFQDCMKSNATFDQIEELIQLVSGNT